MEALYLKLEDLDIIIFMVKKKEKRKKGVGGWVGECVGGVGVVFVKHKYPIYCRDQRTFLANSESTVQF